MLHVTTESLTVALGKFTYILLHNLVQMNEKNFLREYTFSLKAIH